MSQNLKTRREHLKVLPLQKRLQAMEEIRKVGYFEEHLKQECDSYSAIAGCVTFLYTKQGHEYWWNIHLKYFNS